jgi:hypothetical protein
MQWRISPLTGEALCTARKREAPRQRQKREQPRVRDIGTGGHADVPLDHRLTFVLATMVFAACGAGRGVVARPGSD